MLALVHINLTPLCDAFHNYNFIFLKFRFEHREENRKDCLRTLYRLIEEARKADQLVQDARVSHVKNRLRSNPQFMEKLNAKIMRTRGRSSLSA